MVPFVSTRARPFRRDSVACASKIVEYFVAGEMSFISSRHPLVVALVPAMRRCWSCAKHVVKYSSPQADEEPALAVSAFSRRPRGTPQKLKPINVCLPVGSSRDASSCSFPKWVNS